MSLGRQYPPPDVKSWTTFFTNKFEKAQKNKPYKAFNRFWTNLSLVGLNLLFIFCLSLPIIDRCLLLTTKRCVIIWAATVWISTRPYFVEYRHEFDSIRLFGHILFILRLQFSTGGLALFSFFSTRCLARNLSLAPMWSYSKNIDCSFFIAEYVFQ